MKYGFVVPVYNHGSTLEGVVKNLEKYGFPIIVIDDGNDTENAAYIERVAEKYSLVHVVRHKKNGGKGMAMRSGILKAAEMELTHVLHGYRNLHLCRLCAYLECTTISKGEVGICCHLIVFVSSSKQRRIFCISHLHFCYFGEIAVYSCLEHKSVFCLAEKQVSDKAVCIVNGIG